MRHRSASASGCSSNSLGIQQHFWSIASIFKLMGHINIPPLPGWVFMACIMGDSLQQQPRVGLKGYRYARLLPFIEGRGASTGNWGSNLTFFKRA